LFPISLNLFCSSKYHSFWEIKILKTVNKLYFSKKRGKVGKLFLICLLLQLVCIYFKSPQNLGKLFSLIFPILCLKNDAFSQNLIFQSAKKPNVPFFVSEEVICSILHTLAKTKNFRPSRKGSIFSVLNLYYFGLRSK
jgi:hypothetical protein